MLGFAAYVFEMFDFRPMMLGIHTSNSKGYPMHNSEFTLHLNYICEYIRRPRRASGPSTLTTIQTNTASQSNKHIVRFAVRFWYEIYIYIYIERERERHRERDMYIYIHIYIDR